MRGLHVVIGNTRMVRPVSALAVLGRCALEHAGPGFYAPGCPPREEEVLITLCHAWGLEAAQVLEMRGHARQKMWTDSEEALQT